jgi:hypothetical protein
MDSVLDAGAVAWYGAIVATLAFLFNVWKWTFERARLRVSIVATYYDDGGYSKVEKTPHGEVSTLIPYYHLEIINVGERPTTIMGLQATTRAAGLLETFSGSFRPGYAGVHFVAGAGFAIHYGKNLPYVIGPGDVWSCRISQEKIEVLWRAGRPKIELTATCWRRPRFFRVPANARVIQPAPATT